MICERWDGTITVLFRSAISHILNVELGDNAYMYMVYSND